MNNFEILDPKRHQSLHIITERGADFGDDVMYAMAYPFEFRLLQSEYPLLFRKNADNGSFYSVCLFGFEPNENLFITKNSWIATTIPSAISREPFLIADRRKPGSDQLENLVVSVNIDHPRAQFADGERVFDEQGLPTDFLESAIEHLQKMHSGHLQNQAFCELLKTLNLFTAVTIEVPLSKPITLDGFYTIDEAQLATLSGEQLASLHTAGWLESIYMLMASMNQISSLVQKKTKIESSVEDQ